MATEGIERICVETHNWGKAAKFQEMRVRDADGRIWSLQAPPKVRR
jgi:hypothetical protein